MSGSAMPILEALIKSQGTLDDTVVLHINHCMDNSFYFNEQLLRAFHDVIFVATPYNGRSPGANPGYAVYHARRKGDAYLLQRGNSGLESIRCDFLQATRRLVSLALENELLRYAAEGKKILIIEDGGYHYSVINETAARFPILNAALLGAVEQTTAGTKKSCSQNGLLYPVLSVARSLYKVRVESYFVANRVVGELVRMMHGIGEFIDFHPVLLLGYGIIGRSAAFALKPRHMRIAVYDLDPEIEAAALSDGFDLWDGEFCTDMIVLGNTGTPSFTGQMLESFLAGKAKRIFLASSSSKQVEFEDIFQELKGCQKSCLPQAAAYRLANGKEIVLLAEGYPLNFYDKNADSLTFDMIDPVFSEILTLAFYLKENLEALEHRTYLLGSDEALGTYCDEAGLIKQWMEENGLSLDIDAFNVHPAEKKLRQIYFDGSDRK